MLQHTSSFKTYSCTTGTITWCDSFFPNLIASHLSGYSKTFTEVYLSLRTAELLGVLWKYDKAIFLGCESWKAENASSWKYTGTGVTSRRETLLHMHLKTHRDRLEPWRVKGLLPPAERSAILQSFELLVSRDENVSCHQAFASQVRFPVISFTDKKTQNEIVLYDKV